MIDSADADRADDFHTFLDAAQVRLSANGDVAVTMEQEGCSGSACPPASAIGTKRISRPQRRRPPQPVALVRPPTARVLRYHR